MFRRFSHKCAAFGFATILLSSWNPSNTAAFDCAKATTNIETTICGNADTKASDDAMANAYRSLRGKLKADARSTLLESQRSWLSWRNSTCGPVAACLERENTDHQEILANTPAGMVPLFMWQKGGKNRYEMQITGYTFANANSAAEKLFNRRVDALIKKSPLGKKADDSGPMQGNFDHRINIGLYRTDKHLISAVAYTSDFSGGAHPNSWTNAINIDRASGKLLNIRSIFGKKSRRKLAYDCALQIIRDKSNIYGRYSDKKAVRMLNEEYPDVVAKSIANAKRWHFEENKATVVFDSYAVGPYAAGPSYCSFTNKQLRALTKRPGLF